MGSMLVMNTSRDQATGRLDSIRIRRIEARGGRRRMDNGLDIEERD